MLGGMTTVEHARTREHHVVAHALLVLQGGMGIVAALGMVLLMGSPAFALVPLLGCVVLFTLAGLVARRRRWALVAAIILEGMAIAGWVLQVLIGMVPQVDFTVNLVGLLTTLALPAAVLVLCARALIEDAVSPGAPASVGSAGSAAAPTR
jgi:hypothetical protein